MSIPWREGLHLRRAAEVVRRASTFESSIQLVANRQRADARSVMSLLLLCAGLGTIVELEVSGRDEDRALEAIVAAFEGDADESGRLGAGADRRADAPAA